MKREATNEILSPQSLNGQALLKKLPDTSFLKKLSHLKKQINTLNQQTPIIFVNMDLLNSKSVELFELAKTNKVSLVFINEEGIAKEATPASSSAIRLHLETGIQIIPFNEIIRLRANSNYTAFYTSHIARPIVTSKPLKFYASQFDGTQFIRTHRSHLVNKQFIKAYCNENGHHLILNNNQRIVIARRKLKKVLQML